MIVKYKCKDAYKTPQLHWRVKAEGLPAQKWYGREEVVLETIRKQWPGCQIIRTYKL